MSSASIKLKFDFADESYRRVEWSPLAVDAVEKETVRSAVKSFNSAGVSAVAGLYVSDNGANCSGISEASIVVSDEIVLI